MGAQAGSLRLGALRANRRQRACAVAVDAVIASPGLQAGRQRERPARLRVTPELLQRAAKAEERVVVGGCPVDHRFELGCGLLVAAGVKQGSAERLADGGLVGSEVPGTGERDRGVVVVPCLEQLGPASEEVV